MTSRAQLAQTEPLLSYLVRALVRRIDRAAMSAARVRDLQREVMDALYPIAISTRTVTQFASSFADRFCVTLPGGAYDGTDGREHTAAPVYLLVPRVYTTGLRLVEMEHARARPEVACYRWDVACKAIDFEALRMLIHESPAAIVTFAFAGDDESDATLFAPIAGAPEAAPFTAPLPAQVLTPRAFRTVWTLTSGLAHGGDQSRGNVVLFRRERRIDPTTGQEHLVPLFSGNAKRGILRDIGGGLLCQAGAVSPRELPPRVAHALFAGGTIEAGADGADVDLALRRRLRDLLPFWDVFGGVWSQQVMSGLLRSHDPVIVCRENAWLVHARLAPTLPDGSPMPLDAFRASLRPADDLMQLRFATRMADRDLADAEGVQMIWNTEVLLPGTQIADSFQLAGLAGVGALSQSFVAYLLEEFRARAQIGAGNARGHGQFACDPYESGPGEAPLPSSAIYLAWIAEHREEVRALLLAGGKVAGDDVLAGAKKKRGGARAAATGT